MADDLETCLAVLLLCCSLAASQPQLQAHEDAVQSLEFEHLGNFLLSSSADGTVRLWS